MTPPALPLSDKASLAARIAANTELKASDKVVAIALLFRFANSKSGRCNPSYAALAKAVGLARRTVIDSVRRLQMRGFIAAHHVSDGRSSNSFTFPTLVQPATPDSAACRSGVVHGDALLLVRSATPKHRKLNTGKEQGKGTQEAFERFTRVYPKEASMKEVERIFWQTVTSGEASVAELIDGAERYAAQCRAERREDRFIKDPKNWLRDGCWQDKPSSAVTVSRMNGRSLAGPALEGVEL